MPEVVAGIALPEGEPGSALATASGFRAAGGGFEATGGVTQRALGMVGSWQGIASVSFRDRCAGYGDAAAGAQAACAMAARAVQTYARELEEARDRVRRLQREAEECVERIEAAEARAAAARAQEGAARARAASAALSAPLDGGGLSMAEEAQALSEADAAAAEASAAEADAAAARERLEQLREQAEQERERVKEAGRRAASQVQAAAGQLPTVSYPAPPAPPAREEEEDKPWYEDAWNGFTGAVEEGGEQVVGFGKGVGEGVVGIGEGALMLYRLSPTNALIDRDSFEREWSNVGHAAEFARNNPGEFGKAVINWDDLAAGRYGEWLGNLGPDAALAVATAGGGTAATAATRGLRAADSVGDMAGAARTADRTADAARAARGADDAADAAGAADDVAAGTTVYRLHGYNQEAGGLRLLEGEALPDGTSIPSGSWPWGHSWTDVNPFDLTDPRAELGLPTGPDGNPARFLSVGELRDPTGVMRRQALPLDGNPGGAPELLIPDPQDQVELKGVYGVNPEP